MKKIVCFLICISFFIPHSFAEEITTMTVDEAIEYALKNNSSLIDLNKTVDDQEDVYDDAKDDYREWQYQIKNGGYAFDDTSEYLTCWGYNLELAKLQYDSFLSSKKGAELQISYSVKNMIYSIYELNDSIILLEKNIKKQENDVEIAEIKYKLNMITENDLDTTKSTLGSSKTQLDSLKKTVDTLWISLKQVMGYDVNKELIISKPSYEVEELVVENLDEIIEKSLETNISVLSSKIQYAQKENNYILATKTSFFSKDEKKDAKTDYSDAELRLSNSISAVKENLKILYSNVKDKESEVKIAKENLEIAKTGFEQAKVMYEIGLISKNSYLGYELSVENAEKTYKSAIKECILLKDRWNIAIIVGDIIEK